jgi:hypothetical protein
VVSSIDRDDAALAAWIKLARQSRHTRTRRLRIVLLEPDFRGFDRGEDLDVVDVADLLRGVHVDEDGH